ncbi:MAG: response regulator transcription factor, partial [Acidobacteriota bacterium]
MARILVVDDEKDIVELVKYNLEKEGLQVSTASNGFDALNVIHKSTPDLILLDIMMPQLDGLEVCRRLKKDDSLRDIPIIFLTAKSEEVDKVLGLEMGGDDYITKPFSIRELIARVKAVIRRKEKVTPAERRKFGEILVDFARYEVMLKGKPVPLTAKEFALLKALIQAGGRVLTREKLLIDVWGMDYPGETRTVDVHIRKLREKLGETKRIQTVKGAGYKFLVD